MVYCTKCGTENKEEAQYCTNCGEPLREGVPKRQVRRSEEDMCFGGGWKPFWPLLFGIIILLWGISMLLHIDIWPAIIIIIGAFIILRVIFYRRRY